MYKDKRKCLLPRTEEQHLLLNANRELLGLWIPEVAQVVDQLQLMGNGIDGEENKCIVQWCHF
ncbi:hypothetical protein JG687_00016578 [Phytophthora cactorum]|uniref:Uncharacterized protein n=2 Tax=Phytophthora TaxID=4783 RepID=A0A8J5I8B8_9STRA|nr:hypothetical protein JG687_00016578 [Phytophthora cactorum]KAG6950445.1 hypothetical protein JG688_00014162 [Phytophthora aleatoria]